MATSARVKRSSNTTAGALTVFTTAKRSMFFRSSSSSFLCFFRFHLVSWSYLQIIKAKLVKIISKCRGFLTFDNCKPRQSAYCTNTERTDIRKDEKATDDNKKKEATTTTTTEMASPSGSLSSWQQAAEMSHSPKEFN